MSQQNTPKTQEEPILPGNPTPEVKALAVLIPSVNNSMLTGDLVGTPPPHTHPENGQALTAPLIEEPDGFPMSTLSPVSEIGKPLTAEIPSAQPNTRVRHATEPEERIPPRWNLSASGPSRHFGLLHGGCALTLTSAQALRHASQSLDFYPSPGSNYSPNAITAAKTAALAPQTGLTYHHQIGGPEYRNYASFNGQHLPEDFPMEPPSSMALVPTPRPATSLPSLPMMCKVDLLKESKAIPNPQPVPMDEDAPVPTRPPHSHKQRTLTATALQHSRRKMLAQLDGTDSGSASSRPPQSSTADTADITFTPKPSSVFPKVHGEKPVDTLFRQEMSQRNLWIRNADSDPRVAIQVYECCASDKKVNILKQETLQRTLCSLFHHTGIEVEIPVPEVNERLKDPN
ncbi:hypothetical protein SCP_0507560 [Sparassis crispa]|uniref:Uncharacterized protein n=1 Tax=Sparassis crispa TaxID=139825 RepID=A0A401GNE8_9APHY|nr:hypothetical protein SCP_0507560 [Sparassis crispa]GBE83700.1 hypothetical protein SCP_0507560 [Sparassis crispa]